MPVVLITVLRTIATLRMVALIAVWAPIGVPNGREERRISMASILAERRALGPPAEAVGIATG
jgi:hypothetical protein